jgi:hypothetical protein
MIAIAALLEGVLNIQSANEQKAANEQEFQYIKGFNEEQMGLEKNIEANKRRDTSLNRLTMEIDNLRNIFGTNPSARQEAVRLFSGGK